MLLFALYLILGLTVIYLFKYYFTLIFALLFLIFGIDIAVLSN